MIMNTMGKDNPKAVLATTITSYAASSVLTGVVFLGLGGFRLGNLVSFFPRSILTGCIGGVGVFLFLTGVEVSARLDGNLVFTLPVLRKLVSSDTIVLWLPPLILAIILLIVRYFINHPVVLPIYFVAITAVFYFIVAVIPALTLEDLRNSGWMFQKPQAGAPFYHFYSYYGILNFLLLCQ
jgi:sulfate permease, SulP family